MSAAPLPTPAAPKAEEVCRVCLASAAALAGQLANLTRLDPALAKAAIMAEPDLCVSCCLNLGRAAWAMAKITHLPIPEAREFAAEHNARHSKGGIA